MYRVVGGQEGGGRRVVVGEQRVVVGGRVGGFSEPKTQAA